MELQSPQNLQALLAHPPSVNFEDAILWAIGPRAHLIFFNPWVCAKFHTFNSLLWGTLTEKRKGKKKNTIFNKTVIQRPIFFLRDTSIFRYFSPEDPKFDRT